MPRPNTNANLSASQIPVVPSKSKSKIRSATGSPISAEQYEEVVKTIMQQEVDVDPVEIMERLTFTPRYDDLAPMEYRSKLVVADPVESAEAIITCVLKFAVSLPSRLVRSVL